MKTVSIALMFLAATASLAAQGNTYIGSGHVDTGRLSLLAKDIKAAPAPAPAPAASALPRTTDLSLSSGAFIVDRTDLIATPSDQARVLRSLRIDPAPQPPAAETGRQNPGRPLGNASQKR